MAEHVYEPVELVGTSGEGVSDAIHAAVARASATVRDVRRFEAARVRGEVAGGRVARYQVAPEVGFTLEE